MSNAIHTEGTTLAMGNAASPEVFTAIGEVRSITGPGGSASVIDVTNLSSVAKEKMMGLADEGQVTFEIYYIPTDTQHAALRAARAARTLVNFELSYADSPPTVDSFSAYITSMSINNQLDSAVTASITLEVTGAVTTS